MYLVTTIPAIALSAAAATLTLAEECTPHWDREIGNPGLSQSPPWTGASIRALTVWDDGTGPTLYAGGAFDNINGVSANYIARWDGPVIRELGIQTRILSHRPGLGSTQVIEKLAQADP